MFICAKPVSYSLGQRTTATDMYLNFAIGTALAVKLAQLEFLYLILILHKMVESGKGLKNSLKHSKHVTETFIYTMLE